MPAGAEWTITPTTLTEVTAHIRWSGATNFSRIFVSFQQPDCAIPKGIVASHSGGNGSFSVVLEPGISYFLYGCFFGPTPSGGSPPTALFTLSLTGGLTVSEVVALMMVVIGIVLVVVGLRRIGYRLWR